MSDWVTGVFTIGGVAVGILLEPLKIIFTSRGRTRQTRAERCAVFIVEAQKAMSYMLNLNAVHRATQARVRTPTTEQQTVWINGVNTALEELRTISALLRMYGPDELADTGRALLDAVDQVFQAAKTPDEGEFALQTIPPSLQAKVDNVHAQVDSFAVIARKYTK